MRTHTYIIARHGSNAANQSMTPRAVIGTVLETTRAKAEIEAVKRWVFYANQNVQAIPYSKASREDQRTAFEIEAMEQVFG